MQAGARRLGAPPAASVPFSRGCREAATPEAERSYSSLFTCPEGYRCECGDRVFRKRLATVLTEAQEALPVLASSRMHGANSRQGADKAGTIWLLSLHAQKLSWLSQR